MRLASFFSVVGWSRVNSTSFAFLKTTLRTAGLVNLTHTFEKKGAENTANVKGELLLTEGTREGKVLDYFFGSERLLKGSKGKVGDMFCGEGKPYQMISDHAPILLEVDF
tara:strand:+ start:157 stop:486 length:330 start_codon:yes stop_codon:yes gene_type:complete